MVLNCCLMEKLDIWLLAQNVGFLKGVQRVFLELGRGLGCVGYIKTLERPLFAAWFKAIKTIRVFNRYSKIYVE